MVAESVTRPTTAGNFLHRCCSRVTSHGEYLGFTEILLQLHIVLKIGDDDVGFRMDGAGGFGEGEGGFFFAVDQEYAAQVAGGLFEPTSQFVLVCVPAVGVHRLDLGFHFVWFAKDVHFFRACFEKCAERIGRAPAGDQDRIARVSDVVLDVMSDATGLGHSRSADDHAGAFVVVERDGFLDAGGEGEVFGLERIVRLAHRVLEAFIVALGMVSEDFARFQRERAIHEDG